MYFNNTTHPWERTCEEVRTFMYEGSKPPNKQRMLVLIGSDPEKGVMCNSSTWL
jgi:hypothetical protein